MLWRTRRVGLPGEHGVADTGRRKTLIALSGLIFLALVINGVVGLFGVHYAVRNHVMDLEREAETMSVLEDARLAQVSFKIQVQEWKNVLLRGAVPADRERYWVAFEREERTVADRLRRVGERGGFLGIAPERVAGLLDAHAELGRSYRAAIAGFAPAEGVGASVIDAQVRGIDRALTDDIDGVADDIARSAGELGLRLRERAVADRAVFSWVAGIAVGAGFVLVLIFLAASTAAMARR